MIISVSAAEAYRFTYPARYPVNSFLLLRGASREPNVSILQLLGVQMKRLLSSAAMVALLLCSAPAWGQSIVWNFEDGTDQGFGTGFGNDASASFPIVNIGGSNRMEVLDTASFQQAGREVSDPAGLLVLNAATTAPSLYTISYDWYVDTSLSPGNYGTFMQLGTYLNSGDGGYVQDFPGAGKDVELNGAQLASGLVFSGTVAETVTAKYGVLPATFLAQTFLRPGLIINGDGTQAKVYFDNITIAPVVPEPATLALAALAIPAIGLMRRRK
jgi:hypothetical protein